MNKAATLETLAEVSRLLSTHRVEFAIMLDEVRTKLALAEGTAIEMWREAYSYLLFGGRGSLTNVVIRKGRHHQVRNEQAANLQLMALVSRLWIDCFGEKTGDPLCEYADQALADSKHLKLFNDCIVIERSGFGAVTNGRRQTLLLQSLLGPPREMIGPHAIGPAIGAGFLIVTLPLFLANRLLQADLTHGALGVLVLTASTALIGALFVVSRYMLRDRKRRSAILHGVSGVEVLAIYDKPTGDPRFVAFVSAAGDQIDRGHRVTD